MKSIKYYIFWLCACRLRYTMCSAHTPYCHLWSACICNIFPPYLINGTSFLKKQLLNRKCVLCFFSKFCVKYVILRRAERDMIKTVYWSSCEISIIVIRFQWNLNFLGVFSINTQTSNFTNFHSLGANLFHVEMRTDRHDEANSRFTQNCENRQMKVFFWTIPVYVMEDVLANMTYVLCISKWNSALTQNWWALFK